MELQIYNAGIETKTKYLTKELAYFLGGIYAADEKVVSKGKLYWSAPVRYNFHYSTLKQTTEHFDYVCQISTKVNGYTVMSDNIKDTSLDSGKNRLPGLLDCPNDDIGSFLVEIFDSFGLKCNYNTARDRLEGGNPRKNQLRIKSENVEYYMKNIGYISPAKYQNMKSVYKSKYGSANEINGSSLLPGLKYLTR